MILEMSRRSILTFKDGSLIRVFKDTDISHEVARHVDQHGTERISHNRTLDSLRSNNSQYRGQHDATVPPFHIFRTLTIHDDYDAIDLLASSLDVKVSTAWSYLCRMLEFFPSANVSAVQYVWHPLLQALPLIDQTGSLKQVMQRLNEGPLHGNQEWRCIADRFAHIRLARLCLMET